MWGGVRVGGFSEVIIVLIQPFGETAGEGGVKFITDRATSVAVHVRVGLSGQMFGGFDGERWVHFFDKVRRTVSARQETENMM